MQFQLRRELFTSLLCEVIKIKWQNEQKASAAWEHWKLPTELFQMRGCNDGNWKRTTCPNEKLLANSIEWEMRGEIIAKSEKF